MLRILFVHPFDDARPGGAEQSLRHHMTHAPPNVQVRLAGPSDSVRIDRFDALVLGNLRPNGGLGVEMEMSAALRWAARLASYRGFSLRSERDVHPCTHRDGRCLTGKRLRKAACDCSTAIRDAYQLLYDACSAVHFLSPAHQRAINQLIPVSRPQHVIGSPIDLSRFRNLVPWAERRPKALITGDAIRVADTAEQRACKGGFEPERLEYLSVPFESMPQVYNRYQAVVVDPVMFHAFGRVAVEALACGCRVLASERVGAMSWKDPLHASRVANRDFWAMVVQGAMNGAGAPPPKRFSWLRRRSRSAA